MQHPFGDVAAPGRDPGWPGGVDGGANDHLAGGIRSSAHAGTTAAPPNVSRPLVLQRNPTGLAGPQQIQGAATDATVLWSAWPKLTPDDRLARLKAMVNARFTKLGIPEVDIIASPGSKSGLGALGGPDTGSASFMPLLWAIWLSDADLGDAQSRSDVDGLVGSVYHEARHAEQHFVAARYLVSKKDENRLRQLTLADFVKKEAEKQPLKKGKEKDLYELAKRWYPSIASYGDLGARVGEQKTAMLKARSLFISWANYWSQNQSGRTEQNYGTLKQVRDNALSEMLQFLGLYTEYESTVVEKDAWAVGGDLVKALGSKPSTPDETIGLIKQERDWVLTRFKELPPPIPPRD